METLGIDEVSTILRRSKQTVKSYVTKYPERLPPRVKLPGSRKIIWLKSDVEKWLNDHRDQS